MSKRISAWYAAEIRRGISDAKAFVAKGRTIGKGFIFFKSNTATLHGRAFQRTLKRLDTRGLGHYVRRVEFMDGSIEYVNRIYSKRQAYLDPDWANA